MSRLSCPKLYVTSEPSSHSSTNYTLPNMLTTVITLPFVFLRAITMLEKRYHKSSGTTPPIDPSPLS